MENVPVLSCFLSQSSSWPAHLRKRSGTCLNPRGEGEKGREHSISPFLHSNEEKKKKKEKKGEKKKAFSTNPKQQHTLRRNKSTKTITG